MKSRIKYTRFLSQAAVIAAVYTVLTLAFAPLSYGESMIQVRISEMLTILPYYTSAAIPGLFIGVIVSNLFSPVGAAIVYSFLSAGLRPYLTKWA
jgi:uncharacterized membrane protein